MLKEYEGEERRNESWHLSKNIPIAFIFVLIMQFGYVVYKEGETDQRIHNLEATVVAIKSEIAAIRQTAITRMEAEQHKLSIQVQINSVDDKTEVVRNHLNSISNKLDRLIERSLPIGP